MDAFLLANISRKARNERITEDGPIVDKNSAAVVMERDLTLRIILEHPPAGVDFGLQKGKGSKYETVQIQQAGPTYIKFECSVILRNNSKSSPDFFGEFVQGPPDGRFIYLDIGTYAGQKNTDFSRRLKIPLHTIDKETINHLLMNKDVLLEAKVAGTGKDGGPNCGTVKPFYGWEIVRELEV
jgi:hypothetical protein